MTNKQKYTYFKYLMLLAICNVVILSVFDYHYIVVNILLGVAYGIGYSVNMME